MTLGMRLIKATLSIFNLDPERGIVNMNKRIQNRVPLAVVAVALLVLAAAPAEAASFVGTQTGPTEWTYTLTYDPLDNYAVCPAPGNVATITLTGLVGVVSATAPTSTDFPDAPGGFLDTINLAWTPVVSGGGTVVTWTHLGPGTGNFGDAKHVFGFKVFTAAPAANGTVNVASDGFSIDVSVIGPCPVQPADDRDFAATTNGPAGTQIVHTFPANQTTTQRYDYTTHAFELTFTPNQDLDVAVDAQKTETAADWVTTFAPGATCLHYAPSCVLYTVPNAPQPNQYSGLIHVYIDYAVAINACRPRLLHLFETGPKAGTVEDMTRVYYPPPFVPSIDPIGGDTDGFSEFQAVDLGDPDGPLQNAFAGFVKPNPDGTTLANSGRTIPIQFKFTGPPPVARLSVEKIQTSVTGFILQDTDAPGDSFTDNLFKCDSLSKTCQFNLKTTGYTTGTYVIVVNADTFCVQTVHFSVR